MSQLEAQARDQLLRRRNSLRPAVELPADPAARWLDYEGFSAGQSDRVRREVAEIDAALQRIAEGSYGSCLACGGPMGLQRLRAIPEGRYCLGCSGAALGDD